MTAADPETTARELIGAQLKDEAEWVHDLLSLARQHASPIGEETITELMLLKLQTMLGPHLRVEQFTKYVESRRTGADWEWWFSDGAGHPMFGMRVQAKKLKPRARGVLGYDFAYRPRLGKKRQVDRLIAAADRDGIPAVYALYNGPDLDLNKFAWNCCTELPSAQLFGVSLVAATTARRLADADDATLEATGPLSRPWSCSVLCPEPLRTASAGPFWPSQGGDVSYYAADLVTELFGREAESQDQSARQSMLQTARGYREWTESPAYVRSIVEDSVSGDRRDPQVRPEELPDDLGGVVVFVGNLDPDADEVEIESDPDRYSDPDYDFDFRDGEGELH